MTNTSSSATHHVPEPPSQSRVAMTRVGRALAELDVLFYRAPNWCWPQTAVIFYRSASDFGAAPIMRRRPRRVLKVGPFRVQWWGRWEERALRY